MWAKRKLVRSPVLKIKRRELCRAIARRVVDFQAAFGFFFAGAILSSSSPALIAAINVSMIEGSLSRFGTAIAGLPGANSIGLKPMRSTKPNVPSGSMRHIGWIFCVVSTPLIFTMRVKFGSAARFLLEFKARDDFLATDHHWVVFDLRKRGKSQ
jgi:hypothetical protein